MPNKLGLGDAARTEAGDFSYLNEIQSELVATENMIVGNAANQAEATAELAKLYRLLEQAKVGGTVPMTDVPVVLRQSSPRYRFEFPAGRAEPAERVRILGEGLGISK